MLQHQIVQSPARFGLANPNSPSIPNPTPPKPPPTQTHHPQDRNSSTLLSLLPPLPRAQALLQMASLASKLFEILLLPMPKKSFPLLRFSKRKSLKLLLNSKRFLTSKMPSRRLTAKFTPKIRQLLAFANKLKEAECCLDILVDDYSDYRRSKRLKSVDDYSMTSSTVSSQLKLSDILSYAHRISYTTFAPPEFGACQAPLRSALPPARQEEQMRAWQLYSFADLDVGLPKEVETKEKIVEAIVEPPPPVDTNAVANLSAFQGMLPPMPPGWKPGIPVQLPDSALKPPPGWKPGDPVSLPPMDSIQIPRFAEQQMQPHIPQPKQQEVIQVQPVNLDLGGSDTSDYSSDDAGSDDED
ncbi:hypothetical protein Fmac_033031 [Flemingia macrophylla]|uniref:Mediator of RNA polymerase II transcription subunit 4 n=1 Tax=Flemingia macrophylla TaxID=520843 RepID=A0ABD1L6M0_9FABA